jgi:uncharacterized protein (TIGR00255 family)
MSTEAKGRAKQPAKPASEPGRELGQGPLKSESPIYSMTGFARLAGHVPGDAGPAFGWTVTIKSVNHRFLDLHMRMPGGTEALEMQLRRTLKEQVVRGHIEVTLTVERTISEQVQLDRELVAMYVAAYRSVAAEYGVAQEPDVSAILRMPGVFAGHGGGGAGSALGNGRSAEERSGESERLELSVLAEMPALLTSFKHMRAMEGRALAEELSRILDRLLAAVNEVEAMHAEVQQAYAERSRQRIVAILGGIGSGTASGVLDRERMLQEAAILAERSDVIEEIIRLKAHVAHFRSYLETGGELGKKLDFLLQEMNREANTLLSKTAGIAGEGTRVTELGLAIKAEVEKAREQVQNLE